MQRVRAPVAPALALAALLAACSRTPPPPPDRTGRGLTATKPEAEQAADPSGPAAAVPAGTTPCTAPGGPACARFATAEDALRWVLAKDPLVLGVGEAHAQRGTEHIASSTKRFTEAFLPILAPRTSDVVVELWAPDPSCAREVEAVETAQAPVKEAQAETNPNEYLTLGTRSRELGVVPWLLQPTCDDFAMLADAGDDAIDAMLALVKRLTEQKVTQLYRRNAAGSSPKLVVAYGGAMHNDLSPPDATRPYSFGPELDRLTSGRYVELDLIVPEFVKRTPVWEKLPWYASFEAERASGRPLDRPLLYTLGERSFVLVFAASAPGSAPPSADRDAG